jgi:4-oxalomesaconate hydratase
MEEIVVLRILCVGGHPADAFDSAGGTLAHHVARGDAVTVVALTQGTRIHDVVISDTLRFRDAMRDRAELAALMAERAAVKQAEVRRACAFLGIDDVRFFEFDDEVVQVSDALLLRMASLIREVRPDVVITHHPRELGGMGMHHAVTGQLVLEGIAAAGGVGAGDANPPHRVAQVFFTTYALAAPLNALSHVATSYPDVIVDVTDVIEAKVRALDALRSQQYGGDYARKSVEVGAGLVGMIGGISYGEGFISYWPSIERHLPVSPARLEQAGESEAARHARTDRLLAVKVELDA